MKPLHRLTVDELNQGSRLDKFLNASIADMSRSQIQKCIQDGLVLVNGEKPTVHRFLKVGDVVEVLKREVKRAAIPTIPLLIESEDYLVIDKPAGILTHHAQGVNGVAAVTDWLLKNYPEIGEVGDEGRPGLVHRLDKDTSGCLVVARTPAMYEHLKQQFHDRLVKKTYIALVHGNLPEVNGRIAKPIGRSKSIGRMAARATALDGDREAITDYEVMQSFQKYDLVKASPLTGRTHQIRVHFHSLGFPVVGDKIYRLRGQKETVDIGRLFLHASELTFHDLSGQEITARSPLPAELEPFLKELV